MSFLDSILRIVGAMFGRKMIWVEMDTHLGQSPRHIVWLNRKIGGPLRTVSTKWGELILEGPHPTFAGLPLYRYREGNVHPFYVKEGDPVLRQVGIPPHALKTMIDDEEFGQTYRNPLTFWIYAIFGLLVVVVVGVLVLAVRGV